MLVISLLRTAADSIARRAELAQQRRGEEFLAQATDHADLELRQREISRPIHWIPAYG